MFGTPRSDPVPGGLQVTVHLVPVSDGRLVVFDVASDAARGRYLPWAVIDFGQNPYEAASLLADDWCEVSLNDLSLVDVMSFEDPSGGWELALVFRAVLAAPPLGDRERVPFVFAPGHFDAIGTFEPLDLERWVSSAPVTPEQPSPEAPAPPVPPDRGLIF